jgi:RNA polymerase sigma factor (TIGR02999 family)
MSKTTQRSSRLDPDVPHGAKTLLPLVYDELRKLAAAKLAAESPGNTLSATALVHEAYLRLVGPQWNQRLKDPGFKEPLFESRGHFFAVMAEAMRRILIESARRRAQVRRGAEFERIELGEAELAVNFPVEELLLVDEALDALQRSDPQTAELVKLHCFAGLSIEQAASVLGLSARTAYRTWSYARAWLFRHLSGDETKAI